MFVDDLGHHTFVVDLAHNTFVAGQGQWMNLETGV